ncbi:MAG: hypothetical protein KAH57_05625 [Thermoplasmata archaeon]|nr:hypothetical protein [Thermoplasmata archaeon]
MDHNTGKDLFYPYKRVWEALKANQSGFLNLGLVSLIIRLIINAVSMVLVMPFVFIFLIIYMVVVVMTMGSTMISVLDPSNGGIYFVIGLLVLCIAGLFLMMLYTAMVVLINTMYNSESIFIAEKLKKARRGEEIDIEGSFKEIRSRWKEIVKKGFVLTLLSVGCGLVIFIVILPIMFVPYIGYIFMYAIIFILSPLLSYVLDISILGIVRGGRVLDSFSNGVKGIFGNKKGLGYYYLLHLGLMIVSSFIFPLALIVGIILPIITKMLILENPDLFEY